MILFENGRATRVMSQDMFQREFRKLQDLMRRMEPVLRHAGDGEDASREVQSLLPQDGPVLGRSALGGLPRDETAHGGQSGPHKSSRAQTVRALRSILRDTASLTYTLQQQLDELHEKGWNKGGTQRLPPPASTAVLEGLDRLGLLQSDAPTLE